MPASYPLQVLDFFQAYWKSFVILLTPFILCPLLVVDQDNRETEEALRCAFLILLMAVFWLTEALPLPVTSMLPMIFLPLLGLMSTKDVAENYLNSTNYMFFGGLIMAIAVEHCGLHIRVALRIIMLVGTSQARLMLGFMFTTMFISMWISNTATTAMMLPIVDAVAQAINAEEVETMDTLDEKIMSGMNEVEEETEVDQLETEDDENNYDKVNLITDEKLFENQLKSLTHGKVHSISQLKTLSTLDDGPGFFDDLEAITKGHSPEHTLDAKSLKRAKTITKLKSKQEAQNKIRHSQADNKKSTVVEKKKPVDPEAPGKINSKEETERNFLLMGIAIAANIGGTGVVTGSPPNLVVPDALRKKFGEGTPTGLTFASWMAFAIPVMLVNTLLAWLWLQQLQRWYPSFKSNSSDNASAKEQKAITAIKQKYTELGKMSMHEIQVLILFILLILLWFFKSPVFIDGWGALFKPETIKIASATPAILCCVLLFVLPQKYNFWPFKLVDEPSQFYQHSPSLITWRLIETKMCWGVLFLLGGGFALARALQDSGLSSLLVLQLTKLNMNSLPVWLAVLIFSIVTVGITNIASNTATANIFIPILVEMSLTMCVNPIYLTLPAGIACSYAFSLPVSTAPNAIVFGHSSLKTTDMLKAGMMMNLICTIILVLAINTYGILLFNLNEFPDWATKKLDNSSTCSIPSISKSI